MSGIQSSLASLARRSASSSVRVSRYGIIISSRTRRTYTAVTCNNVSPQTSQRTWESTISKSLNIRQFWTSSQYRSYSSQEGQLKQIGFEDINTKISAAPSSTPSNLILIDVREPAELTETGIIPGAISVPLASQPDAYFLSPDEFETRFGYAKPGFEEDGNASAEKKQIIFYCKAGVRARAAAQLAVQAGYDPENIGVYDGSWLDWKDKGGKVDRWEGNE